MVRILPIKNDGVESVFLLSRNTQTTRFFVILISLEQHVVYQIATLQYAVFNIEYSSVNNQRSTDITHKLFQWDFYVLTSSIPR